MPGTGRGWSARVTLHSNWCGDRFGMACSPGPRSPLQGLRGVFLIGVDPPAGHRVAEQMTGRTERGIDHASR